MKKAVALLILIGQAIAVHAEEAECARRLDYNVVKIVERALFRNVISVEQAKALARAEKPFNVLAGRMPTPENANYIRAFEGIAAMSPARWVAERSKLETIVVNAEESEAVQLDASERTAGVIGLVTTLAPPLLGNPFVNTDDGAIYYVDLVGKRVTVKRLLDDRPVWQDAREYDERSFARIRLNPETGAAEMLYYRFESESGWWLGRGKNRYEVLSVDLPSGTTRISSASVSRDDAVLQVAKWSKIPRVSDWDVKYRGTPTQHTGVIALDRTGRHPEGISIPSEDFSKIASFALLPNGPHGQAFAAVARVKAGEVSIEVYWTGENPKEPIFKASLPFGLDCKVVLYERDGDLFLMADQLGGYTRIYRPLRSKNALEEADLNHYRFLAFEVLKGTGDQAYLAALSKDGKQINVLGLSMRTR